MSNMIRACIFALSLGMTMAGEYEWRGIFYTPEASYVWGAQKKSGAYADPAMKLVAIATSGATEAALTSADTKGKQALDLACEDVVSGGVITPAEDKCYNLVFDQTSAQSLFTVEASAATAIAFFTEHLPTEFEETAHYFKDTSGVDIEPVAQDPEGGHGHSHGHGTGANEFDSKCVCQAEKYGWKIDCSDKVMIQAAVTKLDANTACMAVDPPQACIDDFHIMQAHHDHCLHDQLPTNIEKKLHDYEHFYDDCFVKRQYDPALSKCPTVDCTDATTMTNAIATLQAGCNTTQVCAQAGCAAAMKIVLVAHDLCPEDSLPNNLEVALHDHEEPCEDQLCNTGNAVFNAYDDPCSASVDAASRFGSQDVFVVTIWPLLLVLISS